MENRYLLDKVPDFYERLRTSYDQKFYDQEVLGAYLSQDGSRVYNSFDRRQHITSLSFDASQPLLWALDFNVDPMSSVIVQIVKGRVQVLDEIVIRRGTTQQACAEFLQRYPKYPAGVEVYGDASGNAQQTTGFSDYDIIKDYLAVHASAKVEYRVPKSNPSVRERVNLTNSKLQSAAGFVSLVVDEKCKELIQDFEQVCYKAETGQIDKDRDRRRTHLSDALGYLLWHHYKRGPTIGAQQGRIV